MIGRQFVIADTHFNDANIIRFCNRPFSSVEDMNTSLIDRWNSVVEPLDTVWILGDFFVFTDELDRDFKAIVSRLHGHKNLIKGNLDIKNINFYQNYFEFYSPYPILLNGFFLLSHESLLLSETTPYFNIYGHVHNDMKYVDNRTSRCVSVERIGYYPLLLDKVISKD